MERIAQVEGKLCDLDWKEFDWKTAWICPNLSDRNGKRTSLKGFGDGAVGSARESTSCDQYGQPQELQEKRLSHV